MDETTRGLPTVEAEWGEFVAEVFPHLAGRDLEPYRECFLAGFLSMLAIAFRVSNREPDRVGRAKILKSYYDQHASMSGEG